MPQRRTERELLATLSAAAESDDGTEELTSLVQEHGGVIAPALGMSLKQLEAICIAPPMDRTVKVRLALRRFRERHAESLKRQAENLSIAAANMLVGLSRWQPDRVHIDARIVLGTLLANRQLRAIRFDVDVEGRCPVTILRDKVKQASRSLPFSDLRCFIDKRGLNFRWHGERGGLLLVSQSVERFESSAVLTVEFPRPQQKAKPSLVRPSPMTPSAAWLGDVLLDLGFA
jgi:hypothetical protein